MDYKAFYAEVVEWIGQSNQQAMKHGIESEAFWAWVADSTSQLCKRYGEQPLAIKQMMMLVEWLEEVFEAQKVAE